MAESREITSTNLVFEFVSKWKDAPGFISAIAAITYTVGYAITTTHFQKYHIHNPTLIHGRYLSVGLCFFFILSLTYLPGYYLKSMHSSSIRWLKWRFLDRLPVWVPVFFVSMTCSIGVVLILSTQLTLEWKQFRHISTSSFWLCKYGWKLVVGWYLSVFLLGVLVRAIGDGAFRDDPSRSFPGSIRSGAACVLAILLVLFASESYSSYLYAQINQTWGGGQELMVQLILDPAVENKPIPVEDASRHLSKPVALLEQTDKTYIILVNEFNEAIEIDKTMVKGTFYDYSTEFTNPVLNQPKKP